MNIIHIFYEIFYTEFKDYLNNRIGSELKNNEIMQLNYSNKKFNKGDIVAYKMFDKYIISCILNITNNKYTLLSCDLYKYLEEKNDKTIININNNENIIKIQGNIVQDYIPNLKLSEEEVLETYYL